MPGIEISVTFQPKPGRGQHGGQRRRTIAAQGRHIQVLELQVQGAPGLQGEHLARQVNPAAPVPARVALQVPGDVWRQAHMVEPQFHLVQVQAHRRLGHPVLEVQGLALNLEGVQFELEGLGLAGGFWG